MSAGATSTRILDATLERVATVGLAGLALEDVAVDAGVSRQTVYRHFGSRDGLLSAVIVREEERLLATIDAATVDAADVRDALERGLGAALAAAGEHPLLQQLLRTEPEVLLPFLTLGSGPVLGVLEPVVAELLDRHAPGMDPDQLAFVADAIGRVCVSYAISPRDDVAETARRLAGLVAHGVDGGGR